ncbi:MAG: glycosyltransferase [Actinomycetia bacterium]|nr:glycosyltransferase [Actinomycetes bacterium]
MPRFSVVVPAYNAEATLAETLDAVAAQECSDWECIVVDDGSVDGTRSIAEGFSARHARFRVVHQENRGSAGAYNTGVAAAAGEWVCICSADDVLLPEHLVTMARAMDEHPSHDIYSCNGYYWFKDGHRELVYAGDAAATTRSWSLEDVFDACFFSVGACYRRELFDRLGGYPEGAYGEDYIFWMRAMAAGASHLYVPQALALHRISATQKSANLRRAYSSDIESISSILASANLTVGQAAAARAAIAHRRRLILELGPFGGPIIRGLRAARGLFSDRGRR